MSVFSDYAKRLFAEIESLPSEFPFSTFENAYTLCVRELEQVAAAENLSLDTWPGRSWKMISQFRCKHEVLLGAYLGFQSVAERQIPRHHIYRLQGIYANALPILLCGVRSLFLQNHFLISLPATRVISFDQKQVNHTKDWLKQLSALMGCKSHKTHTDEQLAARADINLRFHHFAYGLFDRYESKTLTEESIQRDVARLAQIALEWDYQWKMDISKRRIGNVVHSIFEDMRRSKFGSLGPLPPSVEEIDNRLGVRHLQKVIRAYDRRIVQAAEAAMLPTPPNSNTAGDCDLRVAQANPLVRKHLRRHPDATIRDVASAVGCSTGLVFKTNAWKASQARREQSKKAGSVRAIALTGKMEDTAIVDDNHLAKLIEEQEQESRADQFRARKSVKLITKRAS